MTTPVDTGGWPGTFHFGLFEFNEGRPQMGATMKVGDRVVIRHNPHDGPAGEDVLGEVVEFKPGAGFNGCDLAEVRHVVAGVQLNMPFSLANLEVLTAETADALAADYDGRAAHLRRTAAWLRGSEGDAFVGTDWGSGGKTLGRVEMSRMEVLANAGLLLLDVHDGGEGETAMERAAWRCCLRHGLEKMAREMQPVK